MATSAGSSGTISISDTAEHTLTFTAEPLKGLRTFEVQLRVTSGTCYFDSLATDSSSAVAVASGDGDVVVTVYGGILKYHGANPSAFSWWI